MSSKKREIKSRAQHIRRAFVQLAVATSRTKIKNPIAPYVTARQIAILADESISPRAVTDYSAFPTDLRLQLEQGDFDRIQKLGWSVSDLLRDKTKADPPTILMFRRPGMQAYVYVPEIYATAADCELWEAEALGKTADAIAESDRRTGVMDRVRTLKVKIGEQAVISRAYGRDIEEAKVKLKKEMRI